MPRAIQTFEVSLKAFIVRDGRVLLVREADSGFWELPGGRIDVGEEWDAHDRILAREIAEELGAAFRVETSDNAVTWTRRRPSDGMFQFIVGRICRHAGGEPVLSAEHDALAWLGPHELASLTFPTESGYATALAALWQRVTASGQRTGPRNIE
jgi:8-oxo-dGTP pyrophosphatase MutT (NUDIX family)